jgi:hypothetical protein
MRKYFELVMAILLAAALITTAILVIFPIPRPETGRFTEKQFKRLMNGMTRDQVEAILGAPAGDYTNGKGDYRRFENGQSADGTCVTADLRDRWFGPDGAIFLAFDVDGRMVSGTFWVAWWPDEW